MIACFLFSNRLSESFELAVKIANHHFGVVQTLLEQYDFLQFSLRDFSYFKIATFEWKLLISHGLIFCGLIESTVRQFVSSRSRANF